MPSRPYELGKLSGMRIGGFKVAHIELRRRVAEAQGELMEKCIGVVEEWETQNGVSHCGGATGLNTSSRNVRQLTESAGHQPLENFIRQHLQSESSPPIT